METGAGQPYDMLWFDSPLVYVVFLDILWHNMESLTAGCVSGETVV